MDRSLKKVSRYFDRAEFSCRCGCRMDTVDVDLITILDDVRAYFGKPVYINSGCRCYKHNNVIGGSLNSQHLSGKAADIRVHGVEADEVADYLEEKYADSCGIGRYDNFTHIDVRYERARWDNRTKFDDEAA